MSNKSSPLSSEMYHRIYAFAKKNIDAHLIAHTLKIPIKTVENILKKMAPSGIISPGKIAAPEGNESKKFAANDLNTEEDFLDLFLFPKTRFSLIDISGMLTKRNIVKLAADLRKFSKIESKAIAIRLAEVKEIDNEGFEGIIAFHNDLKTVGRFSAILDPSPTVDDFILSHGHDKKIPVFGTESAFEAKAFK